MFCTAFILVLHRAFTTSRLSNQRDFDRQVSEKPSSALLSFCRLFSKLFRISPDTSTHQTPIQTTFVFQLCNLADSPRFVSLSMALLSIEPRRGDSHILRSIHGKSFGVWVDQARCHHELVLFDLSDNEGHDSGILGIERSLQSPLPPIYPSSPSADISTTLSRVSSSTSLSSSSSSSCPCTTSVFTPEIERQYERLFLFPSGTKIKECITIMSGGNLTRNYQQVRVMSIPVEKIRVSLSEVIMAVEAVLSTRRQYILSSHNCWWMAERLVAGQANVPSPALNPLTRSLEDLNSDFAKVQQKYTELLEAQISSIRISFSEPTAHIFPCRVRNRESTQSTQM